MPAPNDLRRVEVSVSPSLRWAVQWAFERLVHMNYSIRKSNPGDLAAVTELLQASYPALMKSAYDYAMLEPALKLMTRANPKLLSSGTYYVAESEDGTLVGCGGWTTEHPGGATELEAVGHIRHFGTHPNWTRRGIGGAIFHMRYRF